MKTEIEQWKQELYDFVDEAEKNGKWLKCNYQDLIFTPGELRIKHKNNQLLWGVVNWEMIDPISILQRDINFLKDHIETLQNNIDKLKKLT